VQIMQHHRKLSASSCCLQDNGCTCMVRE
jgi:hypothetical protein